MSKNLIRTMMSVAIVAMAAFIVTEACLAAAGSKYVRNRSGCLAASGGRSGISAVQYACGKASCDTASSKSSCLAAGGQNGCSLWIGPVGDSVTTTIKAVGTGVIPIAYWGMCTDRLDTTKNITVSNDNDSINDHMNLTRGLWASPRSIGTTLDVAKFIEGLTGTPVGGDACKKIYRRIVNVARTHSDGASTDAMDQEIILELTDNTSESCALPESTPEKDICSSWGNPSSYAGSNENSGTTSIDIRIRNTAARFGGTGFGDWNDSNIYAKPTDEIAWHTCYYPGVQATADTEVSSVNGANWGNYEELSDQVCEAPKSVDYLPLKEAADTWENGYNLSEADALFGDRGPFGDFGAGNTDVRESDNGRKTVEGDAGETFTEKTNTWRPIAASISESNPTKGVYKCKCCPSPPAQSCSGEGEDRTCTDIPCTETNTCYCCTNRYASPLKNALVNYGPTNDAVSVLVPYNFELSTSVDILASEVYAGETIEVDQVTTTVMPRYNGVTIDTYATEVPNAKVKLFAYASSSADGSFGDSSDAKCGDFGSKVKNDQCHQFAGPQSKTLNSTGNLGGAIDSFPDFETTYDAYDVSAGDYMCFVSAVYPAASDGDKDMSGGNGKWRYSTPTCVVVAKRPSFQVWGGNMYSNSSINASVAAKRNIYNSYHNLGTTFSIKNGSSYKYSSWVEEGLMIGGVGASTNNLASAAATGKNNEAKYAYTGNSGDFCSYGTALTFSNSGGGGCASSYEMNLNLDNDARATLIDYWAGGGTLSGAAVGGDVNLASAGGATVPSASGVNIRYLEPTGDITLHGTLTKSTTVLVKSDHKVTITGDITYASNFTAGDTLKTIPKLVIYASNVDIQCDAGRVDAIIITKTGGTVNTCSNAGSVDASNRSRQLKIFGVVMTDNIKLERTYGSAAWKGSGDNGQKEAAEIFDFDSSIPLWAEYMAGSGETDTMQTAYTSEIAPRY